MSYQQKPTKNKCYLTEQLVVGGLVEHHHVVHILLLLPLAANHPQPTGVLKIHHVLVSFYPGNKTHDTQEHGSQVQGTYMNKRNKNHASKQEQPHLIWITYKLSITYSSTIMLCSKYLFISRSPATESYIYSMHHHHKPSKLPLLKCVATMLLLLL